MSKPPLVHRGWRDHASFVRNPVATLLTYGRRHDVTRMRLPGYGVGNTEYYVVADPDLAVAVLESEATERPNVRQHVPVMNNGYMSDDDGKWEIRRSAFERAFTGESFTRLMDRFENEILETVAAVETDTPHGIAELTREWMTHISVNAICHRPPDTKAVRHLSAGVDRGIRCSQIDATSVLPIWFPRPAFLKFCLNFLWLYRWTTELAAEIDTDTFVYEVLRAADLPERELERILRVLITAGIVSTSVMLTTALCLLLDSGYVGELRAKLDDLPETVRFGDLRSAGPELRWVLFEALRLFPPTFNLNRTATESFTLGRYDVEAGQDIWIDQWSLGRNPAWWDDPDAFDPGRWESLSTHRNAFLPFGAGRRACFGRNLAIREGELILANLLKSYDLSGENVALSTDDRRGRISYHIPEATVTFTDRGSTQRSASSQPGTAALVDELEPESGEAQRDESVESEH